MANAHRLQFSSSSDLQPPELMKTTHMTFSNVSLAKNTCFKSRIPVTTDFRRKIAEVPVREVIPLLAHNNLSLCTHPIHHFCVISSLYFDFQKIKHRYLGHFMTGIAISHAHVADHAVKAKDSKNKNNFQHACAGGISGTIISLSLQPLDVVKTRMIGTQTKSSTSFISTFKEVAKNDGVRGLWSGSVPTIFRVLPGGFIYFGGIHALQGWASVGKHLENPQTWRDHAQNFAIGASARTLAGTVTCPILVVKTRFEFATSDEHLRQKSTIGTLKQIYNVEGVRGLFKGWAPTIARDVPYAGLFLVFYTQTKHLILTTVPTLHEHDSWVTLPSGAAAGGMATVITHPFDVVRTRMQLNPKAKGVIPTFMYLVRNEGSSSLLRGVTSRVVKRSASSALSWALYEHVAHFFTKQW